jgi:hypothetical protein
MTEAAAASKSIVQQVRERNASVQGVSIVADAKPATARRRYARSH